MSLSGKIIIETERLILREMTLHDFDNLKRVIGDRNNMKYFSDIFDYNRVKIWIKKSIEKYKIFGFGFWAICLKETGEMIGDCGVTMQNINGFIRPELGYHLRADMQGNGYVKESAITTRDWIFNNTPFNQVFSYMTKENIPSEKTAISYGCKLLEEYTEENKTIQVYGISRKDWEKIR